jgi:hypothetical protein
MTTALHPDFKALLQDLIERHGGQSKFSAIQREIAATVVQLMLDLRSAVLGETVKISATMVALMDKLPPPKPQPYAANVPRITSSMSLAEAARLYERFCRDVDGTESYDDIDFGMSVIDAVASPAPPDAPPQPPLPIAPDAEPANLGGRAC